MRRWLWMALCVSLAVLLASCGASDGVVPSPTPTTALTAADLQLITAGEAYALVEGGTALLYDTRSLEEYQALHAAGAISFPEAEAAARYGELPTDKGLIFY